MIVNSSFSYTVYSSRSDPIMKTVAVLFLVFVVTQYSAAQDDRKAMFEAYAKTCVEQTKLPAEDLEKLRKHEIPQNPAIKCFGACLLEQMGVMKDGELSQEVADQIAEKLFAGNDDKIKTVKEETRNCGTEVDAQKITDKCEKAFFVLKCLLSKTDLIKH